MTRREVEVMRHLGRGETTKEIAGALCVCVSTIETHVRHLRAKLAFPTRTALVAFAATGLAWEQHLLHCGARLEEVRHGL